MDEIEKLTKQICEQYGLVEREVKERLRLLIREFMVPPQEAKRTVINYFLKERKIEIKAKEVKVSELEKCEPGEYISIKVKVAKVYKGEGSKPSAAIAGDPSGITRIVWWKGFAMEKGKCYEIRKALVTKYRDRIQLQLDGNSEIEEISESVQLPDRKTEVKGAIVAVLKNSGLVPRCPECGKTAAKKVCPTHGKVKPRFEYRAKIVVDNGEKAYDVIVKGKLLEDMTQLTENDAKKLAREAMSLEAVREEIENRLFGKYITIKGAKYRDWVIAEEFEFLKPEEEKYEIVEEEIDMTALLDDSKRLNNLLDDIDDIWDTDANEKEGEKEVTA